MLLTMKYLNLEKGIIGVEENSSDAVENLNRLDSAERHRYHREVFKQPRVYPKGS